MNAKSQNASQKKNQKSKAAPAAPAAEAKIPVDAAAKPAVVSEPIVNANIKTGKRVTAMTTLTLKYKPNARKADRLVIFDYTDRPGSVQFLRTLFGEEIPATIEIAGEFAGPKEKLTKEQLKERRKNMTPADKLAAAEARVQKLRAKMEAAKTAAEQPEAEAVSA